MLFCKLTFGGSIGVEGNDGILGSLSLWDESFLVVPSSIESGSCIGATALCDLRRAGKFGFIRF